MPKLSEFYGIVIMMRYIEDETHKIPHIHVRYGEFTGSYCIKKCSILAGDMPRRADKMVSEWIGLHQSELLEMWETQNFSKVAPLE